MEDLPSEKAKTTQMALKMPRPGWPHVQLDACRKKTRTCKGCLRQGAKDSWFCHRVRNSFLTSGSGRGLGKYIFVSRSRGVLGGAVDTASPSLSLGCTPSLALCHPLLLAPRGAKIIWFSPTMSPHPLAGWALRLALIFSGIQGGPCPPLPPRVVVPGAIAAGTGSPLHI